ncbi:MAG: hypothetical protein ACUZ8H_03650 [Candidatus Anammoxibacter sp.]
MKQESFKKKIEQELEKLNKEQVVNFAWRCAVRALPFLGNRGNFDFWNKKDRQKYIYAVFFGLDINATNSTNVDIFTDAYVNADDAATAAASDSYAIGKAVACTTHASSTTDAVVYISEAAKAAAYAAYATDKRHINLEDLILEDLRTVQVEGKQHVSTKQYGEIWRNFQKALKAEGCEYWGELYKGIFDNGFELDRDDLERRLSVPREIREQGATVVGNYLKEIEEKGATRFNEARIIILGEKGAGKTCLARRLINPNAPMTTDNESTAGVDTTLWELKEENINVRIWDFAGHTVSHAVHQFFLVGALPLYYGL